MRIIYLHQYFKTPRESGGTRSYEMARVLIAAGHSVVMVTSDQNATGWRVRREHVEGIDVRYVPVKYHNSMQGPQRIVAFIVFAVLSSFVALTVRKADAVFATSTPLTIAIPGMLASRALKLPFIFEVRDMWPDVPIAMGRLRTPALRWPALLLERAAYASATRIVALAPGMKDEIVAKGVEPSKVAVIPNGCDNGLFESAETKALVEPAGQSHIVLFAGTLGAANGVHYLAQVAAEMRALSSQVEFVILGDGAERATISAYAQSVGILDSNFHLLGSVPKTEVARWLERATMSVCLFDGPEVLYRNAVQNKFFDSVASGVPVACNFVGWQTQIALDADIGVLLPPESPSRGAEALLEKLQDQEWLANATVTCQKLANGPFDRIRLARRLEALIEDAVRESSGRGPRDTPLTDSVVDGTSYRIG